MDNGIGVLQMIRRRNCVNETSVSEVTVYNRR